MRAYFKAILICTLLFCVGCSKLPWKGNDGNNQEASNQSVNISDQDVNRDDVQVDQLYGLHTKQGAQIDSHKEDIQFLESKIDSIGSDVAMIMSLLKDMQQKFDDSSGFSNDTTAVKVVGEMAQLQMKVKLNKDRVDRYTMFFDSVRFDMNEKYVILDNEVSTLRKALSEYMSGNNQSFASPTAPSIPDPQFRELYSDYYKNYINENYDASIKGFQELLSANSQHDLSENCQYWMGEAYFAKGDYLTALDAFKKVFDFPNDKKEDDAQLKLGICYIKLENNSKAKEELQNYVNQYPRGEFVSKAKSYLTQLD